MKTAANKSSYNKLYLVQPEVYNNMKPQLNEVENQELNDLNEKYQEGHETFEEEKNEEQKSSHDEEINDDAEEVNDDVVMDPPTENEKVNNDDPNIPVEEPKVGKPKISMKMVRNPDGKWTIKKASEKKVKNFSCEICENKEFTTKRSLQRHNVSFHVKKQPIKGAEVIPEVIYPKTTSPKIVKADERKNLKRKHHYNPGDFHLVNNDLKFSKDEPVVKKPKGVSNRVPKRLKAKRKLNDNSNDIKAKEWHWESYSQ